MADTTNSSCSELMDTSASRSLSLGSTAGHSGLLTDSNSLGLGSDDTSLLTPIAQPRRHVTNGVDHVTNGVDHLTTANPLLPVSGVEGKHRKQLAMDDSRSDLSGSSVLELVQHATRVPKAGLLATLDQDLLQATKQELDIANKEKQTMKEMIEQLGNENTGLRAELKARTLELEGRNAEVVHTKEQLSSLQQETEKLLLLQEQQANIAKLDQTSGKSETEKLVDDLSCCRMELKAAKSSLLEKQALVERLKSALKESDLNCKQCQDEAGRYAVQTEHHKRELSETSQRLKRAEELLLLAEEDIASLNKTISQLKKTKERYIQKEFETMQQVRESLETAEAAILRREEASQKEKQMTLDMKRLQTEKTQLLEEMAGRITQDVATATAEHQNKITELLTEISTLQTESCDKQASLERLQRERRSLEKELEKARKRPEPLVSEQTLAELRQRVNAAEISRDEAVIQANDMTERVKQLEGSLGHATSSGMKQVEELRTILTVADQDIDRLRTSEMTLGREKESLRQQLKAAEEAKKAIADEWMLKVAAGKQELQLCQEENIAQLRSADERQHKAINELRDLLTAQQRIGNKWRLEAHSISEKLDKVMKEARESANKTKQQKHHYNSDLHQAKSALARAEDQLHTMAAKCDQLSEELQHAEYTNATSTAQVQTLLARERQLLEERRSLQTELYRFQLDAERGQPRQRSLAATLPASAFAHTTKGSTAWPVKGSIRQHVSDGVASDVLPRHSTHNPVTAGHTLHGNSSHRSHSVASSRHSQNLQSHAEASRKHRIPSASASRTHNGAGGGGSSSDVNSLLDNRESDSISSTSSQLCVESLH